MYLIISARNACTAAKLHHVQHLHLLGHAVHNELSQRPLQRLEVGKDWFVADELELALPTLEQALPAGLQRLRASGVWLCAAHPRALVATWQLRRDAALTGCHQLEALSFRNVDLTVAAQLADTVKTPSRVCVCVCVCVLACVYVFACVRVCV